MAGHRNIDRRRQLPFLPPEFRTPGLLGPSGPTNGAAPPRPGVVTGPTPKLPTVGPEIGLRFFERVTKPRFRLEGDRIIPVGQAQTPQARNRAVEQILRRRRQRRGIASTIFTGPQGLATSAGGRGATLLGG